MGESRSEIAGLTAFLIFGAACSLALSILAQSGDPLKPSIALNDLARAVKDARVSSLEITDDLVSHAADLAEGEGLGGYDAINLAARLQTRDTEDGDGWALLGRSYVVMGRHEEALAALERARRLLGDSDAQLMADYAAAKGALGAPTRTAAGIPATRPISACCRRGRRSTPHS